MISSSKTDKADRAKGDVGFHRKAEHNLTIIQS